MSLTAGFIAVALVAGGDVQYRALGGEVVGVLVFALGVEQYHRDHGVSGVGIAAVGVGLVGAALLIGYDGVGTLADRLELMPGMVGLFLLAAGLVQVRSGWERHLITVGTAFVLLGAVASGVVLGSSATVLLVSVGATVVAWDVGEHAVNLGEQVGRQAETYLAEVVHGAGSLVVGGLGVVVALGVRSADVTDVPLAGLALLLAAGVILTLALYN